LEEKRILAERAFGPLRLCHSAPIAKFACMSRAERAEGPTSTSITSVDCVHRSFMSHPQSTRPQTIGYALADSPVGQASWIYDKFQAWTDNEGNPLSALSLDEMLDNISLYWFTNSAASSARYYRENATRGLSGGKVELPVGVSVFPREIFRAARSWAQRAFPNLIYW
jgi:hypothetical protein